MTRVYRTLGTGQEVEGDYRVSLRARNNLLLNAIERAGFMSLSEFSRACGIGQSRISAWVSLRDEAVLPSGEWKGGVLRIAEYLGVLPEDLFTESQRVTRTAKEASFGVFEHELLELQGTCDPVRLLEDKEKAQDVKEALKSLTKIQQKVLSLRFGLDNGVDHSLKECGEIFGLSVERMRQIEGKALRFLSHPNRGRKLLSHYRDAE